MAFDFAHAVQAPFRMQPGLRRLVAGSPQLTPNSPGSRHLAAKLDVLSQRPYSALMAQPGFDAAPALDQLAAHAAQEHPEAFALTPDGDLTALHLGWSLCAGELQAGAEALPEVGNCLQAIAPEWRKAALLSLACAEDFAVIDATSGTIPWLAVALPSHWSPAQKVGRPFAEVHAPVADNKLLVTAADHLMRLVTGTDRWERFVWTVARSGSLHAHPDWSTAPAWSATADADALAAAAFLRTEHQTFIPVPGHMQAVFTILIDTQPLAQALYSAERTRAVHDAIASMSAAVLEYRGLTPARDRLLAWLSAHAAALDTAAAR